MPEPFQSLQVQPPAQSDDWAARSIQIAIRSSERALENFRREDDRPSQSRKTAMRSCPARLLSSSIPTCVRSGSARVPAGPSLRAARDWEEHRWIRTPAVAFAERAPLRD